MNFATALFRPAQPVPEKFRGNFSHLIADIAWFGVLNGSTIAFLSIYAARLGASTQQLGLLNAVPAIINLMFALPAGHWLETHVHGRPVFWASIIHRLFYLALIPLPWLTGSNNEQIWAVILVTLLMSIPGTGLAIGFNALFADAVPPEWRGHVAGIRNSVLSLTTITTSLVCGQILIRIPFPAGYQTVFGIGFLGAMLSCYNLWFIRKESPPPLANAVVFPVGGAQAHRETPGHFREIQPLRKGLLPKILNLQLARLDVIRGNYRRVILLLFFFHLTQYLPVPLFSIYLVDVLHLSDQTISFGTAIFSLTVFLGSTQLARWSIRRGNKVITGVGILLFAAFPALLSISHEVGLYILANFIGGFAWALAGGALYNYLLEKVPENDRPAHLAWYNLGFNAAILLGSLAGPLLAGWIGLPEALLVCAGARFLSGVAVLRWG
ncbi:MAG: MFS transporter [Anaerolineaceae bacterium]|nr:MFS transporter [Anaerolineaceae bacterium]